MRFFIHHALITSLSLSPVDRVKLDTQWGKMTCLKVSELRKWPNCDLSVGPPDSRLFLCRLTARHCRKRDGGGQHSCFRSMSRGGKWKLLPGLARPGEGRRPGEPGVLSPNKQGVMEIGATRLAPWRGHWMPWWVDQDHKPGYSTQSYHSSGSRGAQWWPAAVGKSIAMFYSFIALLPLVNASLPFSLLLIKERSYSWNPLSKAPL